MRKRRMFYDDGSERVAKRLTAFAHKLGLSHVAVRPAGGARARYEAYLVASWRPDLVGKAILSFMDEDSGRVQLRWYVQQYGTKNEPPASSLSAAFGAVFASGANFGATTEVHARETNEMYAEVLVQIRLAESALADDDVEEMVHRLDMLSYWLGRAYQSQVHSGRKHAPAGPPQTAAIKMQQRLREALTRRKC